MKHTQTLTSNASVKLCETRKLEKDSMWECSVFIQGTFDSGTVTLSASCDGGATKINLRDVAGTLVAVTANDLYNIRLGVPNRGTDTIELYATMAGAGGSANVAVVVFDNR